jgi:hypothetical protein
MSEIELATLHAEISAFLHRTSSAQSDAESDRSREYWRSRPFVTAAEVEALACLADEPASAAAMAGRLGKTAADTQALLDALTAVGLLERQGDRFAATQVTKEYLRGYLGRKPE